MLYTIGDEENYRQAIARLEPGDNIYKTKGGYAFFTITDAERRICEEGQTGQWCVWGIDATENDTTPAPNGWWRLLTRDATLIDLACDS